MFSPASADMTTYDVTFSWSTGGQPLPNSGTGEFVVTFDPLGDNASGAATFVSLNGFATFSQTGTFSYDPNASDPGDLGILTVSTMASPDGVMGTFAIETVGWNDPTVPASVGFVSASFGFPGNLVDFTNIGRASAVAVPLPPSALLLGSDLLGLVGWRRFRKG
jgi:hypothetical protein